jgi:hypothetical protein
MSTPKLNVTVSQPRPISRSTGHHWFPHIMLKQPSGKIYLGFSAGDDHPSNLDDIVHGPPHVLFETTDQGWNWFLKASQDICHDPWPLGALNDGTILSANGVFMKPSGELFAVGCLSTADQPFTDPLEVPIQMPPELVNPMLPQTPGKTRADMHFGAITQLPNGDVLSAACGRLAGDRNYRAFILKSTDRGASWSYLSTVAADPENKYPEGPNETGIACLPNGDIVCVMRTSMTTPMIQSRSTDGGRTWSKPKVLATNGVLPRLLVMENGILACSFGRLDNPPSEDNAIMFSRDGGEIWTERTLIAKGPSTGYTSMVEIAPGEILYAFDDLGFGWDRRNSIMTANVKVEI